jgi:hypothetical protein
MANTFRDDDPRPREKGSVGMVVLSLFIMVLMWHFLDTRRAPVSESIPTAQMSVLDSVRRTPVVMSAHYGSFERQRSLDSIARADSLLRDSIDVFRRARDSSARADSLAKSRRQK